MSDVLSPQKNVTLHVNDDLEHDLIVKIGRAISLPERVAILKNILNSSKSVSAIAEELNMPVSSVARHINVLEEAGLIYFSYQPSPKGHVKFCSQAILDFTVTLDPPLKRELEKSEYAVEMPLGMFSHCHIKAPCGMAGLEAPIIGVDNPNLFFSPDRIKAECIWFDWGFISYNFPADFPKKSNFSEISFSFEICSETTYYNNNWKSDITVRVNDMELLTFTSPGDFGGRRGKYTPSYWSISSTQFGLLKKVTINEHGVFLDNLLVNNQIRFSDLRIFNGSSIKLDIGIKDNAVHKGGVNLFGKNFGDYPQSIIMKLC